MAKTVDPTTYITDDGPEHEFSWEDRDDPEGGLLQIGADSENGVVYIAVNDQHVVELPIAVARRAHLAFGERIALAEFGS